MRPSEILDLIVQKVEERTEGFDKPLCGKTVGEVCEPIPDDQPLPEDDRFLYSFFKERVHDYWDSELPSDVITLKGASNYQEWRVSWDDYIEALVGRIDNFILHYHDQFKDDSIVDYNTYRGENSHKLKDACQLADRFLSHAIKKSFDVGAYRVTGNIAGLCYHEILSRVQLIEKKEPHQLKAAEAYSYLKRVNIIGTYKSKQKHFMIYGLDWVIRVICDSVDVTRYDPDCVVKLFEKIEEREIRETYENNTPDGRFLSSRNRQQIMEDVVRKMCFETLRNPDRPGYLPQRKRAREGHQQCGFNEQMRVVA